MNIIPCLLWAAITLLPCAWASAQQVNPSGQNLHRTVTHINKPFGKVGSKQEQNVADANPNQSQEKTMPNGDKDFGKYDGLVTIYKQFLENVLPDADKRHMIHGVPLSTYDYHKWTKDDLRVLATSLNSYTEFDILIGLKDVAGSQPNDKLTAYDIACAQNALQELKPDACKSWKSFGNWIIDMENETQAQRVGFKTYLEQMRQNRGKSGALIDLHTNDNIVGNPLDNPAFDHQAALIQLEKAGVTKDASDNLRKPLETAVTDAVKGIKSTITLAA